MLRSARITRELPAGAYFTAIPKSLPINPDGLCCNGKDLSVFIMMFEIETVRLALTA
jgi:hypothetical protein